MTSNGATEDYKTLQDAERSSPVDHTETDSTQQSPQLKRELSGRHMQMIAIGGAIGAGLFVGSGSALQAGGPASLVLCFIVSA